MSSDTSHWPQFAVISNTPTFLQLMGSMVFTMVTECKDFPHCTYDLVYVVCLSGPQYLNVYLNPHLWGWKRRCQASWYPGKDCSVLVDVCGRTLWSQRVILHCGHSGI